jgi:signal transduction histidine kinase
VLVPLTPLVSLDLQSRDLLARLLPRGPAPDTVAIIGIDERIPYVLPETYASLTERLVVEAGARVVVLSLPRSFSKPVRLGTAESCADDYYCPLKTVIARHSGRIVLEAVPANGQVDIFNTLIPFDERTLTYPVEPGELVGVRQFLADSDGIVRHTQTEQILRRSDNNALESFFSTDFLAARKYLGRSPRHLGPSERIRLFGSGHAFTEFGFEQICPPQLEENDRCAPLGDRPLLEKLRGRVVLVGSVDENLDATAVLTPFGDMDALDLHANLIAGLITGQRDRQLPTGLDIALVICFGLVCGWVLADRRARVAGIALLVGYLLLVFALAQSPLALLLPVVPPLATFVFTGNTLYYLRRVQAERERRAAQEAELDRLRRAEREAVLNQAKKLLFRVATDIHDRPLQEMKLVMDNLEELLLDLPSQSEAARTIDRALADLQVVGREIRLELNDLRSVATKLEITPSLKNGLHAGILAELERLVASGELRLVVEREIFPLIEPTADSRWLDAREDLFRFFKEAMTNVVRHAQANGATWVKVSLHQQGEQAALVVENDGPPLGEASVGGGYGTKVMNTIAGELPGGTWERVNREGSGVRVRLIWQMGAAPVNADVH